MLKSEELSKKYSEQQQNQSVENTPASSTPNHSSDTNPSPNSSEQTPSEKVPIKSDGEKPNDSANKNPFSFKDDNERNNYHWKKRLDRQERSHQKQIEELNKKIAELTKEPELNKFDFKDEEEYFKYREDQLRKSLTEEITNKFKQDRQQEEGTKKQYEAIDRKIVSNFPDEKIRNDFSTSLREFVSDNEDFLSSDNGQLFQTMIDESPVGPTIAYLVAKNPKVIDSISNVSKDSLFRDMKNLEFKIIKQLQEKQLLKKKPIPSTGSLEAKSNANTFNAKSWLRSKYPERYK